MRYVILAASVMFFYLWDGLFNGGRYLDATVRGLYSVYSMVGGG